MSKLKKILSVSFLLFMGAQVFLWSFSFEPISVDFAPEGRNSTRSFRLKNDSDEYVAVRISMFSREIDIEGVESREPANDLFTVYPERLVLKPRSVQTVRVKWEGPSDIDSELCFRILAEQLPVDFSGSSSEESGVKIVLRYLGAVYITPEGAQPEVKVDKAELVHTMNGENTAEITFFNAGTKHAVLTDLVLTLRTEKSGEEGALHFSPEELEGVNGENLLPGSKRRFRIAVPESFEGEQLSVEFQYQEDN
jgi:fimbrial chaperone protein